MGEQHTHLIEMTQAPDGTIRLEHVEHPSACDPSVHCHFEHLSVHQGRGYPDDPGSYVVTVHPVREPCLRYTRLEADPNIRVVSLLLP
jgi:hypothetical protein